MLEKLLKNRVVEFRLPKLEHFKKKTPSYRKVHRR